MSCLACCKLYKLEKSVPSLLNIVNLVLLLLGYEELHAYICICTVYPLITSATAQSLQTYSVQPNLVQSTYFFKFIRLNFEELCKTTILHTVHHLLSLYL